MRIRLTCTILSLTSCASTEPGAECDTQQDPGPEVIYCAGAADCPMDPPGGAWWCHQIQQDDPEFGAAWGTCRLEEVTTQACYAIDPGVYSVSADVCEEVGVDLVPYACVGFDTLPSECVDPMRRIEPAGNETLACCCNSRLDDSCDFFR